MTAPVMMTNCPSDETLAAFIDGRLEGEARLEVLEHVSTCSECRDVFQTAHEIESMTTAHRSWLVPAASLAAAAAIAAAVFLGPAGDGFRRSRNLKAISEASAVLKERPIQARPSIDIAYKPPHAIFRTGGENDSEKEDFDNPEILDAVSALLVAADKRPNAASLHAAGVALLLADDYEKEAVDKLERAANVTSPSADLLNDLAAAYLENNDVEKAKATIERAWQMKKSANIAWTRAFILKTREAWNDYLKIDPDSPWAVEARFELRQMDN